jgi:hypothetical protein
VGPTQAVIVGPTQIVEPSTIDGRLIVKALRSWKGEAAVIEQLREDYARRQAGEDVTPGVRLNEASRGGFLARERCLMWRQNR